MATGERFYKEKDDVDEQRFSNLTDAADVTVAQCESALCLLHTKRRRLDLGTEPNCNEAKATSLTKQSKANFHFRFH